MNKLCPLSSPFKYENGEPIKNYRNNTNLFQMNFSKCFFLLSRINGIIYWWANMNTKNICSM